MASAQLGCAVADFLKAGGMFPSDSEIETELVAPNSFDPRGLLVVEPKKDNKARVHRSPDRAEAMMLAIYEGESLDWIAAPGGVGRGRRDREVPVLADC